MKKQVWGADAIMNQEARMYPSTIRQRMAANSLLLGASMFTREPHIAAALYQCKPDWVFIDQEHSPWGTESIGMICIMARQAGIAGVIRVPWNSPGEIKKAYDVGAVGVTIPQVDNPEEIAQAIQYSKYPPIGERGISPWFAAPLGISADDVIANANDETILLIQLESREAYERLDDSLKLEHFEVLFVGPYDLSASLGFPGKIHHAKVEHAMLDVARKVQGSGKTLATTFADPADCRRWIGEGYRMMNLNSVLSVGTAAAKRIYAELREEFDTQASA